MTNIYNVLQVGAALHEGGVERTIIEMDHFLNKQGWGSFSASAGGKLENNLINQEKHFKLPLQRRDPFTIVINGFKLASLIRKHDINLIHGRSRAPSWSALLASKLTGVPLINTFHGTYGLKGLCKKLYNSSMVRGIHTIANSHFTKKHIIENYGVSDQKIIAIPRGFDPQEFNADNISNEAVNAILDEFGVNQNAFKILMPGRIRHWKGHLVLLEALTKLKNDNWVALIVGGGRENSKYFDHLQKRITELGFSKKVLFTGSRSDIATFYKLADVTISPSIEPEAFGRTIVESQAMGTPVIASNHGGATETIENGKTGWHIKPNDAEELANKLNSVMVDETQRKSIGTQAKKAAHMNFTIENMCINTFKVYKFILEEVGK